MRTARVLNVALKVPQLVTLIILAVVIAAILVFLGWQVYIMLYKPEHKGKLQAKKKEYFEQREIFLAKQELAAEELRRSESELEEKSELVKQLNSDTDKMRAELIHQGVEENEAKRISEMTLEQLLELKSKEQSDVSGNYLINAITRKVLIDSEFDRCKEIEDIKVPQAKTFEFNCDDIVLYIKTLPDIVCEKKQNAKVETFNISNRAFVLLKRKENGFHLKIKCGTHYGQRLSQLFPNFFAKSKFPSGLLWFEINEGEGCSYELVCLLTVISYNIAKAGY